MKRILPLLLVVLLLAACGTAVPEAGPSPAEGPDENELPILPLDGGTTPAPADGDEAPADGDEAPAPALSDTEVTLDGISSYLRLTLPEGWTREQAEGPREVEMIVLRPADDPEFSVELRLWNDGFPGLCGTGMTISEYTLSDGRTATLAYEIIDGSISWWLILPESPDSFTLQFNADMTVYEAHRAELELMMDTIRQGVLAGPDAVKPAEESA